jgi:glucose-1-phosphate adenylyltransferase
MGILALDENGRVVEWHEKPRQPKSDLASMGVYVFSKRALHQWLADDRPDFGHNVIPAMIEGGARVYGYRFDGYWQDVGTVQSYWEANLALLADAPELDLYDREWVIHTRSEERAPAKIGSTAQVHRSLISHGCVINGSVVNSVLSPGVVVDVGAVVRDSIILFDSVVRPGAVVDRAILDKEVAVGPGAIVGEGTDYDVANRKEPGRLNTGITVVGKRAVIPRGVRIGRNVLIGEGVRAADFASRVIKSGSTVERSRERVGRAGTHAGEPPEAREALAVNIDPADGSGDATGRSSAGGRRASGESGD